MDAVYLMLYMDRPDISDVHNKQTKTDLLSCIYEHANSNHYYLDLGRKERGIFPVTPTCMIEIKVILYITSEASWVFPLPSCMVSFQTSEQLEEKKPSNLPITMVYERPQQGEWSTLHIYIHTHTQT